MQTTSMATLPARWSLISKFYLPSRSGRFLRLEFINIINNSEKLQKFTQIMLDLDRNENELKQGR